MDNTNTIDLLRKEDIKWGAEQFDNAFDFKEIIKNNIVGTAIELFDGKVAEGALNFGNKRVSPYVPDDIKDEIHLALDDIINGDDDYRIAIDNGIAVLDNLKNKLELKPFVSSLLTSLLEMVKAAILIYLDNREKE